MSRPTGSQHASPRPWKLSNIIICIVTLFYDGSNREHELFVCYSLPKEMKTEWGGHSDAKSGFEAIMSQEPGPSKFHALRWGVRYICMILSQLPWKMMTTRDYLGSNLVHKKGGYFSVLRPIPRLTHVWCVQVSELYENKIRNFNSNSNSKYYLLVWKS
jgi:hypothetical protein